MFTSLLNNKQMIILIKYPNIQIGSTEYQNNIVLLVYQKFLFFFYNAGPPLRTFSKIKSGWWQLPTVHTVIR